MEWKDRSEPKSENALHLDGDTAKSIRRVYGYAGHIRRLPRSDNADSSFFPPLLRNSRRPRRADIPIPRTE